MTSLYKKLQYWRRRRAGQLRYYGLHQLDRKLEPYLPGFDGVFIEAGANDGISFSNTALLEFCKGWRGLLVEPIPEKAEACLYNRPGSQVVQAALGSPAQAGQLVPMTSCDLMSFVDGAMGSPAADADYVKLSRPHLGEAEPYTVQVPITTLSDLIDRFLPGTIDLLSLDVEGYEPQALDGLDLQRHRPRLIMVECLFHTEEIRARLTPHYDFVTDLGESNLLFRLRP